MTDRFRTHPPIGRRPPFPVAGMPGRETFPYEGDIRVQVRPEPELPEVSAVLAADGGQAYA